MELKVVTDLKTNGFIKKNALCESSGRFFAYQELLIKNCLSRTAYVLFRIVTKAVFKASVI
jgi:hypothetical protein